MKRTRKWFVNFWKKQVSSEIVGAPVLLNEDVIVFRS